MTGVPIPASPSTPPLAMLIFDLDGVLADTTPCHRLAWSRLWDRLGLCGPAYEEIAGQRTLDVVRAVTAGRAPTTAQVEAWVAYKQAEARRLVGRETIVFDDVAPVVGLLRERGVPLALGTSASRHTATAVLARLGLEAAFNPVVAAEDVARAKPHPEVYERIVEAAGLQPRQVLVVEDSEAGVAAAVAAGVHVVSVRTGVRRDGELFLAALPDLRSLPPFLGLQPGAGMAGGGAA